jgi:hypothetical protein
MSQEIISPEIQEGDPTGRNAPKKYRGLKRLVWRSVAIFVWAYIIVKLLVFDFDVYIATNYFPTLLIVLNYKAFIFMCAAVASLLLFDKWHVGGFICYLVLFPLISILFIVPSYIVKTRNWIAGFFIINGIIGFLGDFRRNLTILTVLCTAALVISVSRNEIVLLVTAAVMLALVIYIYALRIISVFRQDKTFGVYKTVFSFATKQVMTTSAMEGGTSGLPVAELSELQLQNRRSKLEPILVANRVCLFVASKLRDYQSSKISIIGEVFSIIFLVVWTVVCFSFINLAIYKFESSQFQLIGEWELFKFFYYSFNNFVFSSTMELTPVKMMSESISVVEKFMALFVALILVSTLLSHKNQRQSEELSNAISDIESEGGILERFMQDQFHLATIDDAISEIERVKGSLLKIIVWLSAALK